MIRMIFHTESTLRVPFSSVGGTDGEDDVWEFSDGRITATSTPTRDVQTGLRCGFVLFFGRHQYHYTYPSPKNTDESSSDHGQTDGTNIAISPLCDDSQIGAHQIGFGSFDMHD